MTGPVSSDELLNHHVPSWANLRRFLLVTAAHWQKSVPASTASTHPACMLCVSVTRSEPSAPYAASSPSSPGCEVKDHKGSKVLTRHTEARQSSCPNIRPWCLHAASRRMQQCHLLLLCTNTFLSTATVGMCLRWAFPRHFRRIGGMCPNGGLVQRLSSLVLLSPSQQPG